jgi:signal peptidase I
MAHEFAGAVTVGGAIAEDGAAGEDTAAGPRCWPSRARVLTGPAFVFSLCAALLMGCSLQLARVQGQSMAPTLADADRLIVDKLAYRFGQPTAGDIVMFYAPMHREQVYVKRIIAQAGDTVHIRDGHVFVNDRALDDPYVISPFRSHENWGPYLVPAEYFVVMGDHRNRSSDSRHWGPVPRAAIIGKVHARWWPLDHAQLF